MRRASSAEHFEIVARRIRSRARAILAELPVEDPNVVWARRAALLAEVDGTAPLFVNRPVLGPRGVWVWVNSVAEQPVAADSGHEPPIPGPDPRPGPHEALTEAPTASDPKDEP